MFVRKVVLPESLWALLAAGKDMSGNRTKNSHIVDVCHHCCF